MGKWGNLGVLFNAEDLKRISNDLFFAKSPQAIVKDDSVIFYFTSQLKDKEGKWISKPYWVEFDKGLNAVLECSSDSVLEAGELGTFDEHGIFPFSVTPSGDGYKAYTTGWSRRSSVDIDMSIGLATSEDGYQFGKKFPGPIMTSDHREPFMVGDAFVRSFNDQWFMWYIFGSRWLVNADEPVPQRHYQISQATSMDGINWSRSGRYIIQNVRENECQALPSVAFYRGRYHMVFCHREVFGFRQGGFRGYKLGYAYSDDLSSWVRNDSFLESINSEEGWDSEMQCYPNLFVLNDELYCVYNGNNFGENGFGIAKLNSSVGI